MGKDNKARFKNVLKWGCVAYSADFMGRGRLFYFCKGGGKMKKVLNRNVNKGIFYAKRG